jgi:S-adenosylmethionine decarboxylase proenzyme
VTALGCHLLAEFSLCDPASLADLEHVTRAMLAAAKASGASVVTQSFHHFSPLGVSGVVIISESHLAIHTWPEHRFAAVDFFTCVDRVAPELAMASLQRAFDAQRLETALLERGPLRLKAGLGSTVTDSPLPLEG